MPMCIVLCRSASLPARDGVHAFGEIDALQNYHHHQLESLGLLQASLSAKRMMLVALLVVNVSVCCCCYVCTCCDTGTTLQSLNRLEGHRKPTAVV